MTTGAPVLSAEVRAWQAGGRMVDTPFGRVFVRSAPRRSETAGPDHADPTILLLHGFPSSSFDFREVVERLDEHAWITLDFLGFGLSDKPHAHRYTLFEQADIVTSVLLQEGVEDIVLIAHDMGTSVATELLARDLAGVLPFRLHRAVLTNGSVIIERASLRPSQKVLRGPLGPLATRLTSERGFVRGFAALFGPGNPLSAQEAHDQWSLLARAGGTRILHRLCAYLDERVEFAPRWHGAIRDWTKPLSFLWATADPVATTNVLAGLRELRPAAEVVELPGVGHYPQIEVPGMFTAAALRLLGAS